MKFKYKAKKGPKEIVEGLIEAADEHNAVAEVRKLGLVPVTIQKRGEKTRKDENEKRSSQKNFALFSGDNIPQKHIYSFTKKFKTLIKAHESVLKSLQFLQERAETKAMEQMLSTIIESVREGHSLSESFSLFPQYFSSLYRGIITAGEVSGRMDYALEQIAAYLDKEKQLSRKIVSSLAYPMVMIAVGILTLVALITFVIPKIKVLFEDFVDKLPFVTKVLLNVSEAFSTYAGVILGLFAVIFLSCVYTRNSLWQKKLAGIVKKRMPVIKKIIYNQSLYRFTNGVSVLLTSGVSLLDSIRSAIPLVDDDDAKIQLEKACQQIVEGVDLEESLRENCSFLTDTFVRMIAVGEASGKLDEMLAELAENYAEEVDTETKIVTSLIEPIAVLVVGGLLSFIVIAILLPIFEMSAFVR
ncbi:MAG: type II secretion system F family protein [Candidatus Omnitrophota bacterium]